MSIYDDLQAIKGSGAPIDKLVPVTIEKLGKIRAEFGAVPTDYTSFLADVGAGELGSAAYMLYDGLVEPADVYGDSSGLDGILLFGDDFQGLNAGFDIRDWRVVEIDPTNMHVNPVALDFQSFIRNRIRVLA
ncbi:SMI1/KNR4 family protein [Lysobacter capsici]|uniref:SMI1/KNR4 family protein n=1 Tax=Lysobacter capsici TaxID=435897 RepID=UPI0012FE6468|nr:SMI1/KNR4 family protein [Lysobacter capsici]